MHCCNTGMTVRQPVEMQKGSDESFRSGPVVTCTALMTRLSIHTETQVQENFRMREDFRVVTLPCKCNISTAQHQAQIQYDGTAEGNEIVTTG